MRAAPTYVFMSISKGFTCPHLALSPYCGPPPRICARKVYAYVRFLSCYRSARGFRVHTEVPGPELCCIENHRYTFHDCQL